MTDYQATNEERKCIFCEITRGNIKPLGDGAFWENDEFIAWLSPFPNTEGFALVVTKEHFGSDVLAMPADKLTRFIAAAKTVGDKLVAALPDVGRVGLLMEGMGIDHAHIKLFPMHGTGYLKQGEWRQIHSDNDSFYGVYPGFISSNDGPRADDVKIRELAERLKNV